MSNTWNFLIQKEGETEWSALKDLSPLPAERYQLAAQCDRPNLEVDIRISHQEINLIQTPHPIASVSHRLDAQGFILLLPLTYLSPGQWQIHCFPSVLAEMSGATWRASVQFDITPAEPSALRSENPEKPFLLNPFRSMEIPELLSLPETFRPTAHQFTYIEEAVLTPELEAISQLHYEMGEMGKALDSSDRIEVAAADVKPLWEIASVPEVPEIFETISSPQSVMPESACLDGLETDRSLETASSPSRTEWEEIEIEELESLFSASSLAESSEATETEDLESFFSAFSLPEPSEEIQAIRSEKLPLLELETTTESDRTITESSSAVLAIADTVQPQESVTAVSVPKREISYLVELSYPDHNTTFTIDVVVTEDDNQAALDLHLPELSLLRRKLFLASPKRTKILPPKLFPNSLPKRSFQPQKLQFTKLEPLQGIF
jgi:hypothetical protein